MRARFQIHLSTALILTFAAGVLLWANLGRRYILPAVWDTNELYFYKIEILGWPAPFEHKIYFPQLGGTPTRAWPEWTGKSWLNGGTIGWAIVTDFFIAISLLANVAILCEWKFRRHRGNVWHPGTLVASMLLAGILFYVNFRIGREEDGGNLKVYGWPSELDRWTRHNDDGTKRYEWENSKNEITIGLISNVTVALSFLMNAAIFCEWRIRRLKEKHTLNR